MRIDNDGTRAQRSLAVKASDSGAILGRIGSLIVRLARNPAEIEAAQRLRYEVFYGELGARRSHEQKAEIDHDRIDSFCDHLVVIDCESGSQRIVGSYRLLRQERAGDAGGFYTSAEFDLDRVIARHPNRRFLELGRSCVLAAYRSKRTLELLWQGIWAYCQIHEIDVMAGCASFPGPVPARHAMALSYLAHFHRATARWDTAAVADRYTTMDLMPREAVDLRAALAGMPPLIKGYLRLGGMVGDGCVVDHAFDTTDVLIVLPREAISTRYINYYGADASRFAA